MACVAAGALAFAAFGVSAQEGPSATAHVRASATIVSPGSVQAPAALEFLGDAAGRVVRGDVAVTSPAPHVVAANVDGWVSQGRTTGFEPVRGGTGHGAPQQVRVDAAPTGSAGAMRVTYVVAIIL